jgi:DNA-binding NtrC family response regulator
MQMNFTALVVEDDTLQRETLADLLKDEGLEVIECTTAEAAELVVASTGTELKAVVTDVSLAGEMSGTELAQFTKRRFPHINVVLVSGRPPPSEGVSATVENPIVHNWTNNGHSSA